MLDIMYDVPSLQDAQEVVINEEVINSGGAPIIVYDKEEEMSREGVFPSEALDWAKRDYGLGNASSLAYHSPNWGWGTTRNTDFLPSMRRHVRQR